MENSDQMKKGTHQELKHLGFVRAAVISTIVWLSCLYDYAKHNSGPLRSAVGSVEGAVTAVVTPVYNKFRDVPDHFLAFLDQKVDMASAEFSKHVPPLAKQVASQVRGLMETTAQKAKELIHQAQVSGPLAAAHYAAIETKEVALDQSVKAWSKLDQLPPFHMVAEMVVPTAAHWSNKYNQVVSGMREKGFIVFSYAPLIPVDEISRAFKQLKSANKGGVADSSASAGEVAASQ